MRLILDTHALLWWLLDDPSLSIPARDAIADSRNEVLISAASAWEIATKARLGKLPQAVGLLDRLDDYLHRDGFAVLAISLAHARLAGRLDWSHKDPFDRMLAAQSRIENAPLVTTDAVFAAHGVLTVW